MRFPSQLPKMTTKTPRLRRARVVRGFTLAEVLVTLAIIAVMAAVLLPSLNSQLSKGDAGRVAADLTSIQTGAQAFLSDVHRYPKCISQLTTSAAGTCSSKDILDQDIPSTLLTKWKGPYIAKDAIGNTSVGVISPTFTSVSGTNAVFYMSVSVTGVAASDFQKIDDILDEGLTPSSTAGLVRYAASPSSTLTYLALPIQ